MGNRFQTTWRKEIPKKFSVLLWLILHYAGWTLARRKQIRKSDDICKRRHLVEENPFHLFVLKMCGKRYKGSMGNLLTRKLFYWGILKE